MCPKFFQFVRRRASYRSSHVSRQADSLKRESCAPEYVTPRAITSVAGLEGLSEAQTISTRFSITGTKVESFALSFSIKALDSADCSDVNRLYQVLIGKKSIQDEIKVGSTPIRLPLGSC